MFLLAAGMLQAEVVDAAANGFTVKTTISIHATPEEVYRQLVRNVGQWWSPDHTFSRDARNLSIDDKRMGCFCEKIPGGGGVRHLEVVYAAPGKILVMQGGLGPLQALATAGSLSIQLAPGSSPGDAGTTLVATYAVNGYLAGGMQSWAAPVDGVLAEQMTRLRNFIEKRPLADK